MGLVEQLTDLIARNPNGLGFFILALVAFIEYVFPPFPGDLITLFGAFLVTQRGWPATLVLGATLAGSAAGCMTVYAAGRRLEHSTWLAKRLGRFRPKLEHLVERFRKHGTLYIVINRFLPSVRAFFFLAAGMAELPALQVLGYGLISAALWNGLLIGVGMTVAHSWDDIHHLFLVYSKIAYGVVGAIAVALIARWLIRGRSTR